MHRVFTNQNDLNIFQATYIPLYWLQFKYGHLFLHNSCTGDGQNNGNTRQYRNKTVCVGYTERTL